MCLLCNRGRPQDHFGARRSFLKYMAAAGVAASSLSLFAARPAWAAGPPADSGAAGRRYVLRGGAVMSMDPKVGDFVVGDVLIEGKKIVAVGANVDAGDATVIDAAGRIVMPGFIDTRHHLFETALRSFLADGVLINDGTPSGAINYYEYVLLKFAPAYRPEDVYISELFGSLSQLDDGVTTVHDISQIHNSPEHSDAAVKALTDSGRRAAFGYFEGHGDKLQYPTDAERLKKQYFASDDQLVTMIMGGEIYIPGYDKAWRVGRDLGLQVAAHILSPFGMRPTFDKLAGDGAFNNDNLFVHMTGMSDMSWQKVKEAGAAVSLAVPIEMNMRHGAPPILKLQSLGMEPALSIDVECTLTADFFTQMRSMMNMQRALINAATLEPELGKKDWPAPPPNLPPLLTTRDVLRFATVNGAKALRLDGKVGSLTPGKEADVIVLDGTALNVAPVNNVPGAVVSLMDRTNVETVIVAGKIRKWKGSLLDVDLPKLRAELSASRDAVFAAASVPQDLFRAN